MAHSASPPITPNPLTRYMDGEGRPTIEFQRFLRDLTDWAAALSANAYGQASVAFNASGAGAVPHGLAGTPSWASCGLVGDTAGNEVTLTSVDGTNLNLRARNSTTNAAVAGTFTVAWHAKI